jgi:hypothetical protein
MAVPPSFYVVTVELRKARSPNLTPRVSRDTFQKRGERAFLETPRAVFLRGFLRRSIWIERLDSPPLLGLVAARNTGGKDLTTRVRRGILQERREEELASARGAVFRVHGRDIIENY